jgi:sodium/proline symporter
MSGYMFMGGPAFAYRVGWHALWYAVGDAGGSIFNISVLGRRMRRLSQIFGSLSPIEYLENRYESPMVRIVGSLISLVFLSAYVFAQFIAAGKTLSSIFGFSYVTAIIIGVVVILLYTTMGGYLAVAWNDFFQGIVMVSGMVLVLTACLIELGGLTGLNNALSKIDPTYLSIWGKGLEYQGQWAMILGAILIYGIGYAGLPHCVVRHMSMKAPETARSALIWSTIWNQLFVYSPYLLGLAGIVLLPELSDPEMVIPTLVEQMFPGVIAAIVLAAILAAVLTTADSLLMQEVSILSRDIYERFINQKAEQKRTVYITRLFLVFVGLIGGLVAIYQPPGVFWLVIFAFGVLSNSFLVPYIAAVYSEKANKYGCLGAMIGGGLTNFIWTLLKIDAITGVHPYFAGLVVSLLCYFVFNPFGPKPSETVIKAVRKAKGAASLRVPRVIEKGMNKALAPEANAIADFLGSSLV